MEKIIEGLIILSGGDEDAEQCKKMVQWLNDTETIPNLQHCEGGTYCSYATEMVNRMINREKKAKGE